MRPNSPQPQPALRFRSMGSRLKPLLQLFQAPSERRSYKTF